MAAASSIIGAIGAAVAAGSGIAANVAQNKARGQARYQLGEQRKMHEKALQDERDRFDKMTADSERIHRDNMRIGWETFHRDKQHQDDLLKQGEDGLHLQMVQMQREKANAERNLNNSIAQIQRQMNMSDAANNASYRKSDEGVSGTLLTGPGGIKKEDLKKGKNLLLGGR